MSARARLISGFGATAVGPVITALVQLVGVPAFLFAWGTHTYGEWLILSAVPSYLSMTDMGFGSVAGNDMTMRVATGDKAGALATFQSTWILVTLISLLIGLVTATVIMTSPVADWFNIRSITSSETRSTILCLSLYSLATLHASTIVSGFRSDGRYALGVSILNGLRLTESAAMLLPLYWHLGPVYVAASLASVRVVGTMGAYCVLGRTLPWIQLGLSHASWQRIRALMRPAIAFMAFPAGNAISIQGTTLVIGILLGPIAVATFVPLRTLSRFAYQVIDSIKNAAWPELSTAFGKDNLVLATKLHRSCCQVSFWVSILAIAALGLVGPVIFRVWTHQNLILNVACFYTLLLVVVVSSVWNTSSAVPIAANRHGRIAAQYVCCTAGSLLVAVVLVPALNITGAALALLLTEICMTWVVIKGSNALLKDDTAGFLRSLFSANGLRQLTAPNKQEL